MCHFLESVLATVFITGGLGSGCSFFRHPSNDLPFLLDFCQKSEFTDSEGQLLRYWSLTRCLNYSTDDLFLHSSARFQAYQFDSANKMNQSDMCRNHSRLEYLGHTLTDGHKGYQVSCERENQSLSESQRCEWASYRVFNSIKDKQQSQNFYANALALQTCVSVRTEQQSQPAEDAVTAGSDSESEKDNQSPYSDNNPANRPFQCRFIRMKCDESAVWLECFSDSRCDNSTKIRDDILKQSEKTEQNEQNDDGFVTESTVVGQLVIDEINPDGVPNGDSSSSSSVAFAMEQCTMISPRPQHLISMQSLQLLYIQSDQQTTQPPSYSKNNSNKSRLSDLNWKNSKLVILAVSLSLLAIFAAVLAAVSKTYHDRRHRRRRISEKKKKEENLPHSSEENDALTGADTTEEENQSDGDSRVSSIQECSDFCFAAWISLRRWFCGLCFDLSLCVCHCCIATKNERRQRRIKRRNNASVDQESTLKKASMNPTSDCIVASLPPLESEPPSSRKESTLMSDLPTLPSSSVGPSVSSRLLQASPPRAVGVQMVKVDHSSRNAGLHPRVFGLRPVPVPLVPLNSTHVRFASAPVATALPLAASASASSVSLPLYWPSRPTSQHSQSSPSEMLSSEADSRRSVNI